MWNGREKPRWRDGNTCAVSMARWWLGAMHASRIVYTTVTVVCQCVAERVAGARTHTHSRGQRREGGVVCRLSYQQPKNKTRPAHPTRSQLPSIDDVSARQRQELIHSFTSVSSTLTKSSTNRVLFSSSLFPLFFFFGDLSITIGSTHFLIFD